MKEGLGRVGREWWGGEEEGVGCLNPLMEQLVKDNSYPPSCLLRAPALNNWWMDEISNEKSKIYLNKKFKLKKAFK